MIDMSNSRKIPENEKFLNPALFIERPILSRILYVDFLYRKIVRVPGVIMEFGVRWGQNIALMCNLRGTYEPYNYNRKIIGFDTFSGFPDLDERDGGKLKAGDYGVSENYIEYLEEIIGLHEAGNPLNHLKKFNFILNLFSLSKKNVVD